LRPDVLLHGDGIVGPALDRRVIGNDEGFTSGHTPDAGDETGCGCVVVVHIERRQRRQLEKRRSPIEQEIDALADRQLSLRTMPFDIFRSSTLARRGDSAPELVDELPHGFTVGRKRRVSGIDVGREDLHLPAATVGLEPTLGAAPDRVHAVHLRAAAFAQHLVVLRAYLDGRQWPSW
jgi:hypothetical protein